MELRDRSELERRSAGKWFGYGFSVIIDPEGKVVASAKSLYGSEIVYSTITTAWTTTTLPVDQSAR